jgi:hypothetical protein
MDLGVITDALYESEINCSVATFWDGGFDVKLGDEMNGFVLETNCKTSSEAAEFLDKAAREHFPESAYALGKNGATRGGRIGTRTDGEPFSLGNRCKLCGGPVLNSAKVLTCQKCRAKQSDRKN